MVPSERAPNAFGGELLLIVAQELMAHGREAHGTSDSRFRAFLGRVHGAKGNHAAAHSVDAWLAELQKDPAKAGTSLSERAFLAAARGRREEAVGLLPESFTRGSVFYIRRNLHRFNDWWPMRGYEPFDRLVTPEG